MPAATSTAAPISLRQMFTEIDAPIWPGALWTARSKSTSATHIDRGPYSGHTLDLLLERSRDRETVFLKGNHEAYFLEVLRDPSKVDDWRQFGGLQTLMSYGIQPLLNPNAAEQVELIRMLNEALPAEHLSFLRDLKPSFVCGDFFCPCRRPPRNPAIRTTGGGLALDSERLPG